MSGNKERRFLEICPRCRKTPKEFYIKNSFWYIPEKSQRKERTGGRCIILKSNTAFNLNIDKLLTFDYMQCNICKHRMPPSDDIIHYFRNLLMVRNYVTFGEYREIIGGK